MRKISCIAATALLCNLMPAAQANGAAAYVQPKPASNMRPASAMPVSLLQRAPTVTRGKIAECSNLAAIRALNAKASGADYPAQSRILDLTFVLCLAGTSTEG